MAVTYGFQRKISNNPQMLATVLTSITVLYLSPRLVEVSDEQRVVIA